MLERPYYNLLHFNGKLMFLVRVYHIAVSTASFALNIGTRHIARCIFVQMGPGWNPDLVNGAVDTEP